jgi:hypothetical protein
MHHRLPRNWSSTPMSSAPSPQATWPSCSVVVRVGMRRGWESANVHVSALTITETPWVLAMLSRPLPGPGMVTICLPCQHLKFADSAGALGANINGNGAYTFAMPLTLALPENTTIPRKTAAKCAMPEWHSSIAFSFLLKVCPNGLLIRPSKHLHVCRPKGSSFLMHSASPDLGSTSNATPKRRSRACLCHSPWTRSTAQCNSQTANRARSALSWLGWSSNPRSWPNTVSQST